MLRMAIFVFALTFTGTAAAQKAEIFADRAGAIRGYDPVAYFTQNAPLRGSEKFTYQWKGATWRFASAENRDLFVAAPESYAPQYGGYCAYGVAQNYLVSIEPQAWTIVDGKLYLNYSRSVRETWSKDIAGFVRKADANWPQLLR